ncbi:oligosaccharide flippase family protein [bacterium]|nr:oligosaccharide flippase family protein [bacterium]
MIKRLAGQTALYGIPSIVGRFINFLLIFLFTGYFKPEVFAAHVEFYAYAGFFLVVLPHGMETAFFNFLRRDEPLKQVFTTSFFSVFLLASLFLGWTIFASDSIANFMNYPDHPEYVQWFGWILFFDVIAMIPFTLLRHQQRGAKFALIRSLGIFINIILNVLYIVYFPQWFEGNEGWWFRSDVGIGYVFIANLVSSLFMFAVLLPDTIKNIGKFNTELWRKMIIYASPLILVSLAGMVNETFDRVAMDKLLTSDNPKYDLGVYGAFYKLSIIITIFIQAFRYAAEPFFFEQAKGEDAKLVYAKVMNYFVAVCLSIGLLTLLFLEWIAPFAIRQESYFDHPDGLRVVAPLILANIFLGIVYNLSIWYKVAEKTKLGAVISILAAVFTITCLFTFVPNYGFIAAAYTTLGSYLLMLILSYALSRKYYPIPYDLKTLGILFGTAIVLYGINQQFLNNMTIGMIIFKMFLWLAFTLVAYQVVIRGKKT